MSRLAGKVAIVTGGGGGIGAATAHELAREGAAVAVVDIDETKAAGVADGIRRSGAQAIALGGDLAQEEAAQSAVNSTVAEFGRIDILHNNAALSRATLTPYLGQPKDVADLVVFLASEQSRYITGQMISIDGGMSAHVHVDAGE